MQSKIRLGWNYLFSCLIKKLEGHTSFWSMVVFKMVTANGCITPMSVSLALCQASLKWTLPSNIPPYNKQVGETIIVDLKVTRYNNSACSRLSLTHFSSIFEDHTDNFSAVGLLNNVQWGAPRRASAPDEPHLLHQGELLLDQLQTIRGETSRLTRDRRPHCVNLMHNPVLQSRRAEVFRDRGQPGLQERALSPKFMWYQHRAAGVEPRAGAGWLDLFCPLGVWRANTGGGGEGNSPNSAAGLEGESTAIENTGAGNLLFADKETERVSAKTASCSKLELGCLKTVMTTTLKPVEAVWQGVRRQPEQPCQHSCEWSGCESRPPQPLTMWGGRGEHKPVTCTCLPASRRRRRRDDGGEGTGGGGHHFVEPRFNLTA